MDFFTNKIASTENKIFFHFQRLKFGDLHIKQDEKSGLFAIIAIHNTSLGPAIGGCRFLPYPSFDMAVIDALRLAQSMSYKAAISDLPFGGGKAVLIHPPTQLNNRLTVLQAFGSFVHELGGRYITAEDSGTSVADMDIIRTMTPFVTGHSHQLFSHKDPSPVTAFGVRRGIEAAVKHRLQRDSLEQIHVAIQGVGHVGYHLAKELHSQGAKLTISDINLKAVERCCDEFKATATSTQQIHQIACDVFSPCALSNAVTQQNMHEIQAPIIAGSANNQLESSLLAIELHKHKILYAPDFAINAGGLIYVSTQYTHKNEQAAYDKVGNIYQTVKQIFELADQEDLSTVEVAKRLAEQRLTLI